MESSLLDVSQVPVVILCGGQGSRMREDGEIRPKPMMEIGEKPILWHIMKYYSCFGFRRFILPLGYRGDFIKNYFVNFKNTSGNFTLSLNPKVATQNHSIAQEKDWEITFVETGLHTLKGARIKKIEPFIKNDTFHVTYGDGVSNVDLKKLHQFHLNHGKTGTVTVVRPPSRFGEMKIKNGKVLSFEEKPQLSSGNINGGYFVFNKDFLKSLSADPKCDLEFGALQKIAKKNELHAYDHSGFWQCMDTPRERDFLNKVWEKGAPWKLW
ncbi:MAG: sugar phosphate nucleotidyltransferase [Elusimicrobiota bacterium]